MLHSKTNSTTNLSTLHSARAAVGVVLVASVLASLVWYLKRDIVNWSWIGVGCIDLVFALVLAKKKNIPSWQSTAVYLLCFGLALWANIMSGLLIASHGKIFSPLVGFQVVAVATAIIAPTPAWLGWLTIGGCAIFAPVIYYLIFLPFQDSLFSVQEPWVTLVICLIALVVLHSRLKALVLERSLEATRTSQAAISKFASLFMVLRDLANTPLQTITLTSALLKEGTLDPKEAVPYLERSLARLEELSKVLTIFEKEIEFDHVNVGFEAVDAASEFLEQFKRNNS